MKIVVSDSTPLISLMKAELLDTLAGLFGEVLIPEAVFQEVTANEEFQDEADQIKKSSFIRVVKVENTDRVSFLRRVTGLDLGESEAIVYADDHQTDILLMDEAAGRRVARSMSLHIQGTIGVLLQAYDQKIVTASEVKSAIQKLRDQKRHISEKMYHYAEEYIKKG